MECKAIEYILPNGRREERSFVLSDEYKEAYESMTEAGCRFECERLQNGVVSLTIFNVNYEYDVDIQLVSPFGPSNVLQGWQKLLERRTWLAFGE